MAELFIAASDDNLEKVNSFIHQNIESCSFSDMELMQIDLSVEEIFVNIAHYAYAPQTGDALIQCQVDPESKTTLIIFSDSGIPFDPLKKEDPDITLSAEERRIGGLGIYLVKKYMDKVEYCYRDGKNILTLTKTPKTK